MSSSDSQPRARLDVDADYEGGVEIDGEFFYERKRARRQQTADDALYGYESSDDDGGGRRGRKRGRDGGAEKAPDYSKPVGFVKAGVMGGSGPGDADAVDGGGGGGSGRPGLGAAGRSGLGSSGRGGLGSSSSGRGGLGLGARADKGDDDDDDGGRAGLGGRANLGAGVRSGAPSLGASGSGRTGLAGLVPSGSDDDDAGGGGEAAVLPGEFGRRIKERAQRRVDAAKEASRADGERRAAARRPPGRAVDGFAGAGRTKATPDIGSFEQHTKGIGAKLLSKMGFKAGEGLGRNKQGIAVPVQAKMRPKGMGMGFGDRDEPHMLAPGAPGTAGAAGRTGAKPGGADESDRDIAAAARAAEVALWKKRDAPRRAKREYRTADEVLAEGGGAGLASGVGPILDMRGPTTRVVVDAAQLGTGPAGGAAAPADDADMPMPELQHNLRLLVDLAAAEIARLDARARSERDTATALQREEERAAAAAERAGATAARLAGLDRDLAAARRGARRAADEGADPGPALATAEAAFRSMKAAYAEEYALYGISAAAAAAALPLLESLLADWRPLDDPSRGADVALRWRPLLESGGGAALGGGSDPYERLVRAAVLPRLARALTTEWQARDADTGVGLVDVWERALPPGARRDLIQGIVLPKLAAAVADWVPASDPVPVHGWLHPWLLHAGPDGLADLWPAVRHKLGAALADWHPSDASALPLLRPWHAVFPEKDWDGLIRRAILPKLAWALGEALVINPAAQDLAPWHWAVHWAPLLPPATLISLLEAHFFPRWHAVLRTWLASPRADHDEVAAWYLGWKALLPPSVADADRVRAQLAAGLDAMNAAMGGGGVGGGRGVPPPAAPAPPPPAAHPPAPHPHAGADEPSLRTLVEAHAAEAGLALVPRPGRRHDGRQVYAYGRVPVVLDAGRGAVLMHAGGEWRTASLEDVAAEHARRESARGGGGG